MNMRSAVLITAFGLVLTLAGCGAQQQSGQDLSPQSSQASGVVAGWNVTVTVSASLPAGATTTCRVDAVNSTDATMSTTPLLKMEIRDGSGELVPTGSWQRIARLSQDKGPGSSFYYLPDFTVPPPGRYTIGFVGMKDSAGNAAGAAFTSTGQ